MAEPWRAWDTVNNLPYVACLPRYLGGFGWCRRALQSRVQKSILRRIKIRQFWVAYDRIVRRSSGEEGAGTRIGGQNHVAPDPAMSHPQWRDLKWLWLALGS